MGFFSQVPPGIKIKQKSRLLFILDTSGSMGVQDVGEAFNEVHYIYKTGTSVDIAEVDAQLHRVYPYKGKWDGSLTGRGGTFLSPAIEYFNANYKKYSTLIIMTDGYIESDPVSVRAGKKCLWLVSSNGQINPDWPGYKIKIQR